MNKLEESILKAAVELNKCAKKDIFNPIMVIETYNTYCCIKYTHKQLREIDSLLYAFCQSLEIVCIITNYELARTIGEPSKELMNNLNMKLSIAHTLMEQVLKKYDKKSKRPGCTLT